MSVLVLQGANLGILDKLQNGYVGQLVFHLLSLLNPWLVERNIASLPACLFYSYYFRRQSSIRAYWTGSAPGRSVVILIGCMTFLFLFPDVMRISISMVPFLMQPDSQILCL